MRKLLGLSKRDYYGICLPGAAAILVFAWFVISMVSV